jgi:hypothetical protein
VLILNTDADVAELADALDLGSSSDRSEGSSPFIRTFSDSEFIHQQRRETNFF